MSHLGRTRYLHVFSQSLRLTPLDPMGARTPETLPISVWRARAETIGEMFAQGWCVISLCDKCNLSMDVHLHDVIKLKGPKLCLWNRRAPCRRRGCTGFVRFQGRPPRTSRFQDLSAPD